MFVTMTQVFDEGHAIDRFPDRTAILEVENFELLVSDRQPHKRPNLKVPKILFEYVSPARQAISAGEPVAMADRRFDAFFQSLSSGHYNPMWATGDHRIYRRSSRPAMGSPRVPGHEFKFELNVPGEALDPIDLPTDLTPGFPGEISRQTAPDANGRSVGLSMRMVKVRGEP